MSAAKNCMLVPADHACAPAHSYAAPNETPAAPTAHTDGAASNSDIDIEQPEDRRDDCPNVGDQITAALVATL